MTCLRIVVQNPVMLPSIPTMAIALNSETTRSPHRLARTKHPHLLFRQASIRNRPQSEYNRPRGVARQTVTLHSNTPIQAMRASTRRLPGNRILADTIPYISHITSSAYTTLLLIPKRASTSHISVRLKVHTTSWNMRKYGSKHYAAMRNRSWIEGRPSGSVTRRIQVQASQRGENQPVQVTVIEVWINPPRLWLKRFCLNLNSKPQITVTAEPAHSRRERTQTNLPPYILTMYICLTSSQPTRSARCSCRLT
ncbi:hypothetical protein B0T24DRAFT_303421 [Lasiosphaeria ovina]|uniref:Uncharacterized protein n=1 Tax=Lasiosphaeria ovina TaxID=92902 RepID=A0AAE0K6F2_9PEZI|nr:hypothetical protein B0T24DRAFT_303421 [Lasiosphaeria ovina]